MGTSQSDGSYLQGSRAQRIEPFQTELQSLLAKHGVRTDKRFGQHFLVSTRVVRSIVGSSTGLKGILEIGPGPGVLTRHLCGLGKVRAVELDSRVLPVLAEYAPDAEVTEADALALDWDALLEEMPCPRGIVSNMPYNITGPLLEKVSGVLRSIDRAVLMMQKEVAVKILARPGDRNRGALSVNLQAAFGISVVCDASAGCFLPPPKVDSTVLLFVPRDDIRDTTVFRRVVSTGFRMPRKTLANNLRGVVELDGLGLKESVRPHELTEDDWWRVVERVSE